MTMAQLMEETAGNVTFIDGGLYAVDYESPGYLSPVRTQILNNALYVQWLWCAYCVAVSCTACGDRELIVDKPRVCGCMYCLDRRSIPRTGTRRTSTLSACSCTTRAGGFPR